MYLGVVLQVQILPPIKPKIVGKYEKIQCRIPQMLIPGLCFLIAMSQVVSVLACQQRGWWFKYPPGINLVRDFCSMLSVGRRHGEGENWPHTSMLRLRNWVAPPAPLANSVLMGTPPVYCWWEDETVREWTGHMLSMLRLRN